MVITKSAKKKAATADIASARASCSDASLSQSSMKTGRGTISGTGATVVVQESSVAFSRAAEAAAAAAIVAFSTVSFAWLASLVSTPTASSSCSTVPSDTSSARRPDELGLKGSLLSCTTSARTPSCRDSASRACVSLASGAVRTSLICSAFAFNSWVAGVVASAERKSVSRCVGWQRRS